MSALTAPTPSGRIATSLGGRLRSSPVCLNTRPPVAAIAPCTTPSCAASASAITSPCVSHNDVEPTMSVITNTVIVMTGPAREARYIVPALRRIEERVALMVAVVDSDGRVIVRSQRVVFWDFDGTLAFRHGLWRGSLIEALTAVAPNHCVGADEVAQNLTGGFPWHQPDVEHRHLDADAWWAALTPLFERAYTLAGVTRPVASAAASGVRAHYCDTRRFSLFADTRPVLEQLAREGWRHLIVSNHVPELPEIVHALGLDDVIETVLTSAHTGYEKPNPKMFAEAVARAGTPQEVWMVGDSPTADIAGAEAVGIPAILVHNANSAGGRSLTLHDAAEIVIRASM